MRNKRLVVFVAAVAVAGLATPLVGVAASPNKIDEDSITVSFADINVESAAGARTLYARLQNASEKYCGVESYTTIRSLSALDDARACYTETLSAMVEKFDSAELSRLHNS